MLARQYDDDGIIFVYYYIPRDDRQTLFGCGVRASALLNCLIKAPSLTTITVPRRRYFPLCEMK